MLLMSSWGHLLEQYIWMLFFASRLPVYYDWHAVWCSLNAELVSHGLQLVFCLCRKKSSIVCCSIPLLSILLHKLSILTFRSLEHKSNGADVKIWRGVNNRILNIIFGSLDFILNYTIPVIDTGLYAIPVIHIGSRGLCKLILTRLRDKR